MGRRIPEKIFWKIKPYEAIQLFDRKSKKKKTFFVLEKGNTLWRIIGLHDKKEHFIPVEQLENDQFFYSLGEHQMLSIWSDICAKPIVISARRFNLKLQTDYYYSLEQRVRLIFMADDPRLGWQLLDNGKYWDFSKYGEPFYVYSFLACPVQLESGNWTIAIEQFTPPFFRSKNMPENIQVIKTPDNEVLLKFNHPDTGDKVVLSLQKDYKLKLRPID